MYFHHNHRVAWLSIAKNACRSWAQVFDDLGWIKEDLYQPQVDTAQLEFFGFLRWPAIRHTMGVIEYLEQTGQLALLHNTRFNRVLVSAVFDQHSYPVSQMIPANIVKRTTWFIIDQVNWDYEQLVQNYLRTHGVEIAVPVPRITTSMPSTIQSRTDLTRLKQQYPEEEGRLTKNFLDADFKLYNRTVGMQSLHRGPTQSRRESVARSEFYPWLVTEDWGLQ